MNLLKKLRIQSTVKPVVQNTYTPALSVCDAKRKQFFTSYNVELMNRIRTARL